MPPNFCSWCRKHGEKVIFNAGHRWKCRYYGCKSCMICNRGAKSRNHGLATSQPSAFCSNNKACYCVRCRGQRALCVFCKNHGEEKYDIGQHAKFCKKRNECRCGVCIGERRRQGLVVRDSSAEVAEDPGAEETAKFSSNAQSALANAGKPNQQSETQEKPTQPHCTSNITASNETAVQRKRKGDAIVLPVPKRPCAAQVSLSNCLYCLNHNFEFLMKSHHANVCMFKRCKCSQCCRVRSDLRARFQQTSMSKKPCADAPPKPTTISNVSSVSSVACPQQHSSTEKSSITTVSTSSVLSDKTAPAIPRAPKPVESASSSEVENSKSSETTLPGKSKKSIPLLQNIAPKLPLTCKADEVNTTKDEMSKEAMSQGTLGVGNQLKEETADIANVALYNSTECVSMNGEVFTVVDEIGEESSFEGTDDRSSTNSKILGPELGSGRVVKHIKKASSGIMQNKKEELCLQENKDSGQVGTSDSVTNKPSLQSNSATASVGQEISVTIINEISLPSASIDLNESVIEKSNDLTKTEKNDEICPDFNKEASFKTNRILKESSTNMPSLCDKKETVRSKDRPTTSKSLTKKADRQESTAHPQITEVVSTSSINVWKMKSATLPAATCVASVADAETAKRETNKDKSNSMANVKIRTTALTSSTDVQKESEIVTSETPPGEISEVQLSNIPNAINEEKSIEPEKENLNSEAPVSVAEILPTALPSSTDVTNVPETTISETPIKVTDEEPMSNTLVAQSEEIQTELEKAGLNSKAPIGVADILPAVLPFFTDVQSVVETITSETPAGEMVSEVQLSNIPNAINEEKSIEPEKENLNSEAPVSVAEILPTALPSSTDVTNVPETTISETPIKVTDEEPMSNTLVAQSEEKQTEPDKEDLNAKALVGVADILPAVLPSSTDVQSMPEATVSEAPVGTMAEEQVSKLVAAESDETGTATEEGLISSSSSIAAEIGSATFPAPKSGQSVSETFISRTPADDRDDDQIANKSTARMEENNAGEKESPAATFSNRVPPPAGTNVQNGAGCAMNKTRPEGGKNTLCKANADMPSTIPTTSPRTGSIENEQSPSSEKSNNSKSGPCEITSLLNELAEFGKNLMPYERYARPANLGDIFSNLPEKTSTQEKSSTKRSSSVTSICVSSSKESQSETTLLDAMSDTTGGECSEHAPPLPEQKDQIELASDCAILLCSVCGKSFPSVHQLRLHSYFQHQFDPESSAVAMKCHNCVFETSNQLALCDHESSHTGLVPLQRVFSLFGLVHSALKLKSKNCNVGDNV